MEEGDQTQASGMKREAAAVVTRERTGPAEERGPDRDSLPGRTTAPETRRRGGTDHCIPRQEVCVREKERTGTSTEAQGVQTLIYSSAGTGDSLCCIIYLE